MWAITLGPDFVLLPILATVLKSVLSMILKYIALSNSKYTLLNLLFLAIDCKYTNIFVSIFFDYV